MSNDAPGRVMQSSYKQQRCGDCGRDYLGKSGAPCPTCKGRGIVRSEDDMVKKIVEDSDLFKG